MPTRERAIDRGHARGLRLARTIGSEIRLARRQLGLALGLVARRAGISASELSRIERGMAEWVSLVTLAKLCAIVGLDLTARAYPGGSPMRDARHARLLEKLHKLLHATLRWSLEVPLPDPGDQRAWDALIRGTDWRFGVECELNPIDGQALMRRINLKQQDGLVDGVILLMPDTRQTRAFRREFAQELTSAFPVPARIALDRLSKGLHPTGSSLVIL